MLTVVRSCQHLLEQRTRLPDAKPVQEVTVIHYVHLNPEMVVFPLATLVFLCFYETRWV